MARKSYRGADRPLTPMNQDNPNYLSHMAVGDIAEFLLYRAKAAHHLHQFAGRIEEIKDLDRADQMKAILDSSQFSEALTAYPEALAEIETHCQNWLRTELDNMRDLKHASGC